MRPFSAYVGYKQSNVKASQIVPSTADSEAVVNQEIQEQ